MKFAIGNPSRTISNFCRGSSDAPTGTIWKFWQFLVQFSHLRTFDPTCNKCLCKLWTFLLLSAFTMDLLTTMPKHIVLALKVQQLLGSQSCHFVIFACWTRFIFAIFVVIDWNVYFDIQYLSDLKSHSAVLWHSEKQCPLVNRSVNNSILSLTGQKILRLEIVTSLGCQFGT